MKRSLQVLITLSIVFTTIFAISLAAQQQASQPPTKNKIEGTIITGLSTANSGMPSFTLKTGEGTEYTIHLGTLKNADGEVFAPKVGEAISVVGTPCCGMAAQTQGARMIHAAEITLGPETFRAAGSMDCMMMGQMGQGMMGQAPTGQGQSGQGMQGMMMHPRQPGQGQPGHGMQGMMMCPGMAGQPTPGQSMQGHAMSTPAVPGAMSCCGSAGCAGCAQQQPPAPAAQPEPEQEPEMEHMH